MSSRLNQSKRILILGGGFGGLYTALHLERKLHRYSDVEVTLLNRENFFLFTPMLHEVAAGDLDLTHIVNPVRKLLRRSQFFNGDIKSINLDERRVIATHADDDHDHEYPGFDQRRTKTVLPIQDDRRTGLNRQTHWCRANTGSEFLWFRCLVVMANHLSE